MTRKILWLIFAATTSALHLNAQENRAKIGKILNYEQGLQRRIGKLDTLVLSEIVKRDSYIVVIDDKIYKGNDPYLKGPVKDSLIFVKDIFDPNAPVEFKRILIFTRKKL